MNTHTKAESSVEICKDVSQPPANAWVPRDVALNIALAARALPDIEIKDLLKGIISLVGEPLSAEKLKGLNIKSLKRLRFLQEIEIAELKNVLKFLKGQSQLNIHDETSGIYSGSADSSVSLPAIQKPFDDVLDQANGCLETETGIEKNRGLQQEVSGKNRGYIQVACASNSGDQVDGHFGSCARFLIYQVSPEKLRLVDIRIPEKTLQGDDKNLQRAQLINDCHVLYTVSIGGPAAAKVIRAGLHPIKLPEGGAAPIVLDRLRTTIAETPPPWLAKVMGIVPEKRVRFSEEERE